MPGQGLQGSDDMSKRDINYIKHIKPLVYKKEREDKAVSRSRKVETARVVAGLPRYPETSFEDIGLVAAMVRALKRKTSEDKPE